MARHDLDTSRELDGRLDEFDARPGEDHRARFDRIHALGFLSLASQSGDLQLHSIEFGPLRREFARFELDLLLPDPDDFLALIQSLLSRRECSRALGKTPVEANDYPGFVANRVLMPMINEAIFCLMEGVADRDGIDTVMKLGMAHPMGPLTLADLIGLDTCLFILEVLHEGLGDDKYRPCPLLRRMVAAGHLGRKSGRGFYEYE